MKGALVFLTVFAILLVVTLQYSFIPPGEQIYWLLAVPQTVYPVLGIPATILVYALFNAVVYGIIAWLVFTIVDRSRRRKAAAPEPAPETPKAAEVKKFCINCGAEILETAKYCKKCGASQEAEAP